MWLWFAVWVVFIAGSVVLAVALVSEDTAAAEHELLLDALWDGAAS